MSELIPRPAFDEEEEKLPAASDLISSMFQYIEPESDASGDTLAYLDVMTVDLPIELEFDAGAGEAIVRASAPTQRTLTSVYPVLHQMRVTMKAERS